MGAGGEIVIAGWGGLSIYSDPELRPKNTWAQLDNFDLVIDGSIRKILPAILHSGPFPNVLYEILEYRTAINYLGGFLRDIAIDGVGDLWDIDGSTTVPWNTDIAAIINGSLDLSRGSSGPYLGQMQGYYVPFEIITWLASGTVAEHDAVYRYSATDGNLYVYFAANAGTMGAIEPKWPASGTVNDNGIIWTNAGILNSFRFKLNYAIIIAHSYPAMKVVEWKYDPTNAAEPYKTKGMRIGVSMPLNPFNLTPAATTPNLNGYGPQTGRAYVWTYYNPNTLHDSSPAPFVGPTKYANLDNSGAQTILNGSVLQPLPPQTKGFTTYQSVYLEVPISALGALYGDGYTCIRCWATVDGGSTFFLLTQLYDDEGNLITNGDGSIPVATLTALQIARGWTGYVPLPTPQNAVATARIFDGVEGVVNLAPDPLSLGPASWIEAIGSGLSVNPTSSPLGQATFVYQGTGSGSAQSEYRSIKIPVEAGQTYAFQGYIDNSEGTGGDVRWLIRNGAGQAVIVSFEQADSTMGNVSGTFVAPASGMVEICFNLNNVTVDSGLTLEAGDPFLELGSAISTKPVVYPTPDSSLIYPAPAPLSQQPPPPNCLAGVIFENSLFVVDHNDPTRLWYSNPGDFNSFGINAYFQFPSDRSFSIMDLIPLYDRLLVAGPRQIEQVLSNGQGGFTTPQVPFDPQHGSLAYTGNIGYGSGGLILTDAGIALIRLAAKISGEMIETGFTPESIISRPIKPILDAIDPATIHVDANLPGQPVAVIDNKQDLYLLAFRSNPASAFTDTFVSMPLRSTAAGQFSRITTLPGNGQVQNVREAQLVSNRTYGVLAMTGDKSIWQMFGGTQDGTITATAQTQPLPTAADIQPELWDQLKDFGDLVIEGQDLPNFQVSFIDDAGKVYGPRSIPAGQHLVRVGVRSRQLTVQFVHTAATPNVPMISFAKLTYSLVGKTV